MRRSLVARCLMKRRDEDEKKKDQRSIRVGGGAGNEEHRETHDRDDRRDGGPPSKRRDLRCEPREDRHREGRRDNEKCSDAEGRLTKDRRRRRDEPRDDWTVVEIAPRQMTRPDPIIGFDVAKANVGGKNESDAAQDSDQGEDQVSGSGIRARDLDGASICDLGASDLDDRTGVVVVIGGVIGLPELTGHRRDCPRQDSNLRPTV